MSCFYCEKDASLLRLMALVCSLTASDVYLVRDQTYKGRCVVAYRKHLSDLHELSVEEQAAFLRDLCAVCSALASVYHPDKINLAVYGDKLPHLHFHVVPKYANGTDFGDPFVPNPKNPLYLSDFDFGNRIEEIKNAISEVNHEN